MSLFGDIVTEDRKLQRSVYLDAQVSEGLPHLLHHLPFDLQWLKQCVCSIVSHSPVAAQLLVMEMFSSSEISTVSETSESTCWR